MYLAPGVITISPVHILVVIVHVDNGRAALMFGTLVPWYVISSSIWFTALFGFLRIRSGTAIQFFWLPYKISSLFDSTNALL